MTNKKIAIVWFRQDLRLHDNPALIHAVQNGFHIVPVYILDDVNAGPWKMGGASRWWLHNSLQNLNQTLSGKMHFYCGPADQVLPKLVQAFSACAVFWNRCYEPWRIDRDKVIKEVLIQNSIEVQSFNASLLWEPWEVLKSDGTPYKVFTPYYRKGCLGSPKQPSLPLPAPELINFSHTNDNSGNLAELELMPKINWYKDMQALWLPGEVGAKSRLDNFLSTGLKGYKEGRNRPDLEFTSRLSPHLHFGEISPRYIWYKSHEAAVNHAETDQDTFCSELGWREFSNSLLYYNRSLPDFPIQEKFLNYPWVNNDKALLAWQQGNTGVPIVDAGMRQLWQTGWMHNRVRMIVGSFLVKNLRIHWHEGEKWFWDTLVDANLANNAASWQWIAGCGADAAPYFRIFNPVTQGEKFDPSGSYVRQFVPELKNMPNDYIHKPWTASPIIRKSAGADTYADPIVDLSISRAEALEGYNLIKGHSA